MRVNDGIIFIIGLPKLRCHLLTKDKRTLIILYTPFPTLSIRVHHVAQNRTDNTVRLR